MQEDCKVHFLCTDTPEVHACLLYVLYKPMHVILGVNPRFIMQVSKGAIKRQSHSEVDCTILQEVDTQKVTRYLRKFHFFPG